MKVKVIKSTVTKSNNRLLSFIFWLKKKKNHTGIINPEWFISILKIIWAYAMYQTFSIAIISNFYYTLYSQQLYGILPNDKVLKSSRALGASANKLLLRWYHQSLFHLGQVQMDCYWDGIRNLLSTCTASVTAIVKNQGWQCLNHLHFQNTQAYNS